MELKNLYRIAVFRKVVESGSFTRAAQALRLSKSVVSQHVVELESELGVRLLNRTTRALTVTQEGNLLADAAGKMLFVVEKTLDTLERQHEKPSGLIRMTASHNFIASYLTGAVLRCQRQHPQLEIEIDVSDEVVNIIETGHDVAFRVGWLKSSELHMLKICDFEMVLCASPEHLDAFGPVTTPLELALRPWVAITVLANFDRLVLKTANGDESTVAVAPLFRTNSGFAAHQIVRDGRCIGMLPSYAAREDLKSGRLVRLLPEWRHRPGTISAIYMHQTNMPPRLRAFLDFVRDDASRYFDSGLEITAS